MGKWPVLLMVRSLDFGGCERDAAKIAVGLDRARFIPHVAVFVEGGFRTREVEAAGVSILNVPVRSFANSSALYGARKLGRYLRQHGIKLLHAFDVPVDIFAAPVARLSGVPVVITSQLSFRNMYKPRERLALRVTDWLADRVVVNSRAVAKSLQQEAGFPAEKIYLCYNGVNPAEFHPGPGVRPPALEGAALIIGSVCVMRPEKRIDWLIRSFSQLRNLDSGARLLLLGGGGDVPRLMELRDRLGLHDVCHFEPAHADVAEWMRSIDIYVNCSSSESFPNGLLEAMACGCCVIGSNVGGIPELITHGQDGLLFDSNDAEQLTSMLRLAASNAVLRRELRERAVETAHQHFSMEVTLQRTEALYEQLLQQRGIKVTVPAC